MALLAESAEVLAHTAANAIRFLEKQFLNRKAYAFAMDCIALLERKKVEGTSDFYHKVGDIYHTSGETDLALSYVELALDLTEAPEEKVKSRENFNYASILLTQGRMFKQRGDVDRSLDIFKETERRFDALGDRRSRAVTLGDIARIMVDKGDVDEALKLHQERLDDFQNLGDLDGIANTLWSMAKIDVAKQDYQKAYERLSESYRINMQLGRLDGICFVGMDLGRILCGGGRKEMGLEILKRSRDGFIRLGQQQLAQQVDQLIKGVDDESA